MPSAEPPPVSVATDQPPASSSQSRPDPHAEDLRRDAELGKRYAAEVEKQFKLSKNDKYQDRVQRIGRELAEIANSMQ
ncbi:MAG: hypothetical protein WHU10_11935, partial [Fimbriimonadales bacterium]